jgi:hypothetical protein
LPDLPDINVWVALVYEGHEHHQVARDWFEGTEVLEARFCRVTQLGLLRLLTLDAVMGVDALGQRDAWAVYDSLARDPRVSRSGEPEGLDPVWRGLTLAPGRRSRQWTDAYLAAFSAAAELRLVTFDRALGRSAPGRVVILTR